MISYETIKKIMFNFQPETAHTIAEMGLRALPYCRTINNKMVQENFVSHEMLTQEVFGVKFQNPIGLGAGFDKNATMVKAMPACGFGYTEIGTMTPKSQPGNPKPRLFRYPEEESIQNAMGFNNHGAYEVIENLKKVYPFAIPIGASIGKNKNTPENEALNDYETLIKGFRDICDYMVVNISSPNTPNLRDLQNEEFIKAVFSMAKELTDTPILLKIAPDMQHETAITLCKTAIDAGADGIIATNTTNDYSLLPNPQDFGGLSGKVLSEKSYELFKAIGRELHDKTTLISVGGIGDAQDAYRRIKAG
ncbi:MAG: dihydroorotate dehydrogenase (quinone), partial [Campylobacterota bacterium]|nr:dihydroorotate dehydrogenase (quinone) [Campylobacterota bacterium]